MTDHPLTAETSTERINPEVDRTWEPLNGRRPRAGDEETNA